MKLIFHDYALQAEKMPDRGFTEAKDLSDFLDAQTEIMGELACENGFKLDIGIDGELGMVQYMNQEGDPPYLMALTPKILVEGSHDFIMTGAPSEILGKHCLPIKVFKNIVMDFFETGQPSQSVEWEEC